MGVHMKYGWCPLLKTWVPRDEMRAVNVHVYDDENVETRIRIRLSPEKAVEFEAMLRELAWDGVMYTQSELEEHGMWPDTREGPRTRRRS